MKNARTKPGSLKSLQKEARSSLDVARQRVRAKVHMWMARIARAIGLEPNRANEAALDKVDVALQDSFPASDPPAYGSPHAGPPRRRLRAI